MQAPRSTINDLSYDNCSVNRRNKGLPYPRTCQICGLGRCRYNFTPQPQEDDSLRDLDEYFEDAAVGFLTKRGYRVYPGNEGKTVIIPSKQTLTMPEDEKRAIELLRKRGYLIS